MSDKTIEELAQLQCLGLLEAHHFGRVGFLDGCTALPVIVPVNYIMHAETVVFRTDPGSKFGAALRNVPVAFEIDGIDQEQRTGWSVLVRGHAAEVVDSNQIDELRKTPLVPWAPGDRSQYVQISPELMTGRRISVGDLPYNWWG